MENNGLFEGDIILRPDQIEAMKRNGSAYGSVIGFRWPENIVPYTINGNIGQSGINAVNAAIADYHKYTCLKFEPYDRTNPKHRGLINFQNGGGCSSPIGFNNPGFTSNGVNNIELAQGCRYKGIVMHEMGHSIGLYHEQSRPDRDSYVRIISRNVYDQKMVYNFKKYTTEIDSLGTPYDFESMMHYDSTAFGCNNYGQNCKTTIQTIDPSNQGKIGQRNGFSAGDIAQINKMYNCNVGKACVDKSEHCNWWAGEGDCDTNPDYMLKDCAKSCAEVAGDKNVHCSAWANSGQCQKNSDWMSLNCKKSCCGK